MELMRGRVLPLSRGSEGDANASPSPATSTSRGPPTSGAAAVPIRPSTGTAKPRKRKAAPAGRGASVDDKRTCRGYEPRKKQRLALVAVAAGVSALVLAVALLLTPPTAESRAEGFEDAADNATVDRFLEWFRASGGHADGVGIAEFPGMGRGVVAQRDIRQEDAMLFVPKSIIMCADTIFTSPTPREVLDKLETLRGQEDALLTAFLLLEQRQRDRSRWFPYLQLLPPMPLSIKTSQRSSEDAESPASPLFFPSDDAVEQLQDAHMVTTAREERERVRRGFRRFKRLFIESKGAASGRQLETYGQYAWARFLVNSRAFSIQGRRFLVPFGDLFNGQSQPQTRIHDNGRHFLQFHELQSDGMSIKADRDTARALQVFEDYGDNDNYIYFLYHGFLMPDNAFDCAMAQLPPLATADAGDMEADKALQIKTRVLRHFGVANGPMVCVSRDGSVREAPMARFYMALHRTSASRMRGECDRVERYTQCFLSTDDASERKSPRSKGEVSTVETAQFLLDAVRHQLEAYPTTLTHDERLIREHKLQRPREEDNPQSVDAPNVHAVRFRASRKRILSEAATHLAHELSTAVSSQGAESVDSATSASDASTDAFAAPPTRGDDRFERFQQYIRSLQLPINHLELRYVDEVVGFGTFATKPLQEGDVYLRMPVSAVMDARTAVQSPSRWLPRVVRALGGDQSADVWLTLHLLDEKFGPRSAQSRWKPYLDMLPPAEAGAMGSPLFYREGGAEMQLLARTDLSALVEGYRRRVGAMFSALSGAISAQEGGSDGLQLGEWLTRDRFLWATAVMDSRSIWWGGQRHLVPLLDMVNCRELGASHKAHQTRVGDNTDVADTRASWAFAAGDEVVENYGQPNHIYLLYHGFVLARNSHDCAHLRVDFGSALRPDGSAEDAAAVAALRRRVAARLEPLGVSAWQWDVCVAVDDAAAVDRFARLALYAVDPKRAVGRSDARIHTDEAAASHEEAAAAWQLVQSRLDKLETGEEEQEDGDCERCRVVRSYMSQQRQQLLWLQAKLATMM